MDDFIKRLKEQMPDEFGRQDKRGVYGFTQKIMAYNSNKIKGSTLTIEQTASLFDTGTIVTDSEIVYRTFFTLTKPQNDYRMKIQLKGKKRNNETTYHTPRRK